MIRYLAETPRAGDVDDGASGTRLQSIRDLGDRVIGYAQDDHVALTHAVQLIVMEESNLVAHVAQRRSKRGPSASRAHDRNLHTGSIPVPAPWVPFGD
jgi:hypothetical protein